MLSKGSARELAALPDYRKQWGARLTLSLHQFGMLVALR